MKSKLVKIGIVGLGRWAKVLTQAAQRSTKFRIVAGYSRSEEKRQSFQKEFGIPSVPDMETMLADPEIQGVILTVPNEQHLPVADQVARAGKQVYTEKPIANTLESGLAIEALQEHYGVQVMVGHSARLLKGVRMMRAAMKGLVADPEKFLIANGVDPLARAETLEIDTFCALARTLQEFAAPLPK